MVYIEGGRPGERGLVSPNPKSARRSRSYLSSFGCPVFVGNIKRRVQEPSTFLRYFLRYLLIVREVALGLLVMICLGAIAISIVEKHTLEESLYFAFITGLSIGFGDIAPQTTWGRVISVGIGLVGIIFVGLTVAVATRALAATVADLRDKDG